MNSIRDYISIDTHKTTELTDKALDKTVSILIETCHAGSMITVGLHDWINAHDEKNDEKIVTQVRSSQKLRDIGITFMEAAFSMERLKEDHSMQQSKTVLDTKADSRRRGEWIEWPDKEGWWWNYTNRNISILPMFKNSNGHITFATGNNNHDDYLSSMHWDPVWKFQEGPTKP